MEEPTITDNIRQGKLNWAKMGKRILKEATDQMGGSDIPAYEPIGSGEKPQIMKNVAHTVSKAGETPEFKNLKKDILLSISKAKNDQVIKLARMFKNQDTSALSLEDFITTINEIKNELISEKQKLSSLLNETVKKYNTTVDVAIEHALGANVIPVEHMKLPEIHNIDDFRNLAIFFGDYDNIIQDVVHGIKAVSSKNILGAPILDEAFSGKRNVLAVNDTLSSLMKMKDRLSNKFRKTIEESGLLKHLSNAFLITAKIEVLEALIKGFEQKLQRLNASKLSKDANEAKRNAEMIVLDPIDFGVNSNEIPEPIGENLVTQSIKQGPGKIYDINQQVQESREENGDISNRKNMHLIEGWDKIADRSIKSAKNVKPNEFTLLIG